MLTRRHIRIKVMQSVYSFKVSDGKMLDDEIVFFKDSIAKSYDLYFLMFSLLKSIKQYADDQLDTYNAHEILKDQKYLKLKRLSDNRFLGFINQHKVLNKYLDNLNCNKHIILGMMANKDHQEYLGYFKNIASLTTVDIPNQTNAIKGIELKNKFPKAQFRISIQEAINKLNLQENDIVVITGSFYLAGEVLNLN